MEPRSERELSPDRENIAALWRVFLRSERQHDIDDDDGCRKILDWPPDVFGLIALLLRRSGAYTRLPRSQSSTDAVDAAVEWRTAVCRGNSRRGGFQITGRVADTWEKIWRRRHESIRQQSRDPQFLFDLLEMLTLADQASKGFGLAFSDNDSAEYEAASQLTPGGAGATLSKRLEPRRARVLPKTHTAPYGLTMRSWSHHLAYVEGEEVKPLWYVIPGALSSEVSRLNLLVVPWPPSVTNAQFHDRGPIQSTNNPELARHRYFDFEPEETCGDAVRTILRLVECAQKQAGTVDAVVLPELALSGADYRWLRRDLLRRKIMLVAGVGGRNLQGVDENRISIDIPLSSRLGVHLRQRKHHPWRIHSSQIKQYGLGSHLDPSRIYWEHIEPGERHLSFFALRPWLVTSVLVCEDLARREPAGELIRSVGPNLVIALLMDGPQIVSRWSARYAASLADDPGCSVLSVTSLAMTRRSNPFGREARSRVVALWRDAENTHEIELPEGQDAVLLMLNVAQKAEWTANLRKESDYAFYPVLSGWLNIKDPGAPDYPPNPVRQLGPEDEVTLLAPSEASALAQLASLLKQNRLSDGYLTVLKSLRGDGRLIARMMVEPRFPKEWREREEDELTPEDCLRRAAAQETADEILAWYDAGKAFQHSIGMARPDVSGCRESHDARHHTGT